MNAEVRVLLVEDDDLIQQALGMALADEGFEVRPAMSGEDALIQLDAANSTGLDVVLLDLTLPGMDGLDVCRTLRARGDLPIIIVTARAGTTDVVGGLEAGADDYVTKPLVASELAARIRALLRRRRPADSSAPAVAQLGDVELRRDEHLVLRHGSPVHLTRTEFLLLAALVDAAGRPVGRRDLLRQVWGYEYFPDTRLLDVHVRRLRRKIEDDPDNPRLVQTVRGVGYKVNTQVER